jgi:hypothetical protein
MGLRIRQMIRRVHPRIPHLGYAPLGVVGLMLSKTSFHYLNARPPVDYSFGVCSRRGFSFQIHTATDGRGLNRPRVVR